MHHWMTILNQSSSQGQSTRLSSTASQIKASASLASTARNKQTSHHQQEQHPHPRRARGKLQNSRASFTPSPATSMLLTLLLIFLCKSNFAAGQRVISPSSSPSRNPLTSSDSGEEIEIAKSCICMKYWECINSGGTPYAYCGINDICCAEKTVNSATVSDESADSVIFSAFGDNRSDQPASNKISNCGKKGFDSNREGIADPGEWAWHTAILEKAQDLYVCGASLLDEFWVLTAAHCVDDYKDPSKLKVRVGEHDVSSLSEPIKHEEYDVHSIFVHPRFNNNSLINDIALLRLMDPVKKKNNINIVCLPDTDTFTEQELFKSQCFITGWGRRDELSEHSLVLKEVKVPLWPHGKCQSALRRSFGANYVLPKTNICAGEEGNDACDGDGGGPLVCEKNGSWYQVGIVSFGIGCGRKNTPGVYTKVNSYTSWIYSTALNETF